MTVFGVLDLGSAASFVALAVFAATRPEHGHDLKPWPWLIGLAVTSTVSVLVLSQIDPQADEPYCYASAVTTSVAAAMSGTGWARQERITWTLLGLAFLVLLVTAKAAASGFGVA